MLFGFRWRALIVFAALLLLGGAALALDLANEGRIYDYLWRTTGETEPEKQLLGYTQYLASFTRRQPDTQPYAHVQHADVNPYGVNTFLNQEVEPEKRELQVQMIVDAGFHWIRQQFPWEDIEHHGKGDFMDRRNDVDGDDIVDEISAWDKYENIVDLAEEYNLEIIARLGEPPAWSQPEGTTNHSTPPSNVQDFVDYAVAVATQFQGRIQYYQVWNEPNLYPEWGDQTVNAEAYTDLLCRTYTALKAVDPEIVVITGALGPTIDLSGRNAYDLLYLQRMYQAGAGDCFDILSVQGYGLWSGPTDHRLRQTTINYQRQIWLRDMMVANGDADKPIWISEAGWNPVPDNPAIADPTYYGHVTPEEAAEWAPLAYERAIQDWPWVGVITYWYFKRADDSETNMNWYYFRLLEPDFTPTPTYESLRAYITDGEPKTLGAGRHGVQNRGVIGQNESGQETRTFRVEGTGVYVCGSGAITYRWDDSAQWQTRLLNGDCTALDETLSAGEHDITMTADDWTAVDSLVVVDFSARHAIPWILAGLVAAVLVLGVFGRLLL
jgi:hypothetical protein